MITVEVGTTEYVLRSITLSYCGVRLEVISSWSNIVATTAYCRSVLRASLPTSRRLHFSYPRGTVGGSKDAFICLFCAKKYACKVDRIRAHVAGVKGVAEVAACPGPTRGDQPAESDVDWERRRQQRVYWREGSNGAAHSGSKGSFHSCGGDSAAGHRAPRVLDI